MPIAIVEESPSSLAEYARVPIAFEVREILEVTAADQDLGGLHFRPLTLESPCEKDYDSEASNHPTHWPSRFDMRNWGILARSARCIASRIRRCPMRRNSSGTGDSPQVGTLSDGEEVDGVRLHQRHQPRHG